MFPGVQVYRVKRVTAPGPARGSARAPEVWQGAAVTSYRVSLVVGMLRPGASPEAVLPAAAAAAREVTEVEAYDLGIVRGEARVTVRYLAEDDDRAAEIARAVRAAAGALVEVGGAVFTRRYGPRWHPVPGGIHR